MATEEAMNEEENPEVVNLVDSQAERIEADLVRTSRTYVNSLDAEEVDLYQSGSLKINSGRTHAESSLLGISQGQSIEINNSILLAGRASEIKTTNSAVGGIIAENVSIGENTNTGVMVGGNVTGEKIRSGILVARHIEGPVETNLDTQQVALASILAGLACGAVIVLGKFLFRRR
ncbi:hypothetical protein ACFLTX_00510 [Chloroflexota bacterium]